MEDKIFNDLENWQKDTQGMLDNLTNFVEMATADLTPEQKAEVDKEMNKFDLTDFKKEMDKISKKMNDQFANINKG